MMVRSAEICIVCSLKPGSTGVRCVPRVIRNNLAFTRAVLGNRLRDMVADGSATASEVVDFWNELEDGEQHRWLCTGVVCFTVVGRRS